MVRPVILKNETLTGIRGKAAALVEHPVSMHFITALILINALTLGLETNPNMIAKYGKILSLVDNIVLVFFSLEIFLKLTAYRLNFFRAGWNVFDFIIVGIALLPSSGPFAVLRALRILRVLRLISTVSSMRRVITALLKAIPGMASIMAILLIIFYVAAVLSTKLFGGNPDPIVQDRFGDIGASMYSLFQIMTLEGWSEEIVRPVMNHYPMSWLFFIPFIILTSFAVLNLFIGIIVDTMNIAHSEDEDEDNNIHSEPITLETLYRQLDSIQKDMTALKKKVK